MIEAVLFDHDGVIANTEPLHLQAINLLLQQFGHPLREKPHDLVGLSTRETWHVLTQRYSLPDTAEHLAAEKTRLLLQLVKNGGLHPTAGLQELLQRLAAKQYKLGLVTGGAREATDAMLAALGIRHYFQTVVTGNDVTNGKPHPEGFLKAAAQLRVPASHCLVIEDSARGIAAAKQAGMYCLALSAHAISSTAEADRVVKSLDEVFPIVTSKH